MATVAEINEVIASGEIAEFTYKGETRVVNPVEVLESKTGNFVLVGQEEAKGWRRYHIDKIENVRLVSLA